VVGILRTDLRKLSRARLKEAEVLYQAGKFDAAVYLCGYSVELALKHRICMTLGWKEYPASRTKYHSFFVHDLEVLLHLSGREAMILSKGRLAYWNSVADWNPEYRYNAVGTAQKFQAEKMIKAVRELLRFL
jgi:HEPN domain-containing protein